MFDSDLPYEDWLATKETVHRFAQIVGKLRLSLSVRRNHWWNVPFHLTASGITTRPMGTEPTFAVDLDFLDHRALVTTTSGDRASFGLAGRSVATLHAEFVRVLDGFGIDTSAIREAAPFDLPDADRRFADDTEHDVYDPAAATRYFRTLSDAGLTLEEFAARFSGKTSPVHHFWHTFDIALTRFADVSVEHGAETDPVTREAYSREVTSFGFWFGDAQVPYPAFYAYTSPEPEGLAATPLPAGAEWASRGSSHLAIYPLRAARATGDPRGAALDFFETAYLAGARLAGWDIERYRCVDGVTDPHLSASAGAPRH